MSIDGLPDAIIQTIIKPYVGFPYTMPTVKLRHQCFHHYSYVTLINTQPLLVWELHTEYSAYPSIPLLHCDNPRHSS